MKMNTIASILEILEENTHVSITQSQKEATFDSYLTKILSIQSTLDKSRDSDTSGSEHIQFPTNSSKTNDGRIFKKPQEVIIPDSDDNEDKLNKKQKLLENDMPWFI